MKGKPSEQQAVTAVGTAVILVGALRAVVEVAMLALLGQGLLALIAGTGRAVNPVYRMFMVITEPALRALRFVVPRRIGGKHLPFAAFFILFWLWLSLAYVKRILAGLSVAG